MKLILIFNGGIERRRELPSMLENAIQAARYETRLQSWVGAAMTVALADNAEGFRLEVMGWRISMDMRRTAGNAPDGDAPRIILGN